MALFSSEGKSRATIKRFTDPIGKKHGVKGFRKSGDWEGVAASDFVDNWAGNTIEPEMFALKRRAKEKFGITDAFDLSAKVQSKAEREQTEEILQEHAPMIDDVIDAQYAETQKFFKDKGITELTIYRGMTVPANLREQYKVDPPPRKDLKRLQKWLVDGYEPINDISLSMTEANRRYKKLKQDFPVFMRDELGWPDEYVETVMAQDDVEMIMDNGSEGRWRDMPNMPKDIDILMEPLSSWTVDYNRTGAFGTTAIGIKVPVTEVYSLAQTGTGDYYEYEVVLIGGKKKARVLR